METTPTGAGGPEILAGLLGCRFLIVVPGIFLFTLVMALKRKTLGWIVAAVASGVLGLALLVVGAALAIYFAAAKAVEAPSPPSIEVSTVATPDADGFATADGLARVSGPPGWRVLDLGTTEASLSIGNELAEEYLIVLSEPKSDFPEGFGLRDFAAAASSQSLGVIEDAAAGEFAELNVGGRPALRLEISGAIDGLGVFYLNTYVDGREYFHQVMAWGQQERRDELRDRLGAAADTFRETLP